MLGLLLVLASSAPAFAQTNEAMGEKLFREAQDEMKAGHFAEACAKFAASNRADAQLGTLLNLAACHEAQGKPASAWTDYTTLADLATKAHDDARADYARKRATALEPTLPQLDLRVPASITLTDVSIDDQHLATATLSTTIPVDPGLHTISLATTTAHWTQSVTIGATGKTSLDVHLPGAAKLVGAENTSDGAGLRRGARAFLGLGAASVVIASVFGLVALAEKGTVDGDCTKLGVCSTNGYDASFVARASAWVSTIGFGLGIAFVATSIGLFVAGGKSKRIAAAPHGLAIVF